MGTSLGQSVRFPILQYQINATSRCNTALKEASVGTEPYSQAFERPQENGCERLSSHWRNYSTGGIVRSKPGTALIQWSEISIQQINAEGTGAALITGKNEMH